MKTTIHKRLFILLCFSTLFFTDCHPLAPVKIACVGDGNTAGIGITNPKINSYPAKLQTIAGEDFIVGNFGTYGATVIETDSTSYIKSLSYTQALEFEPDIIILALGWNDIEKLESEEINEHFINDYNHLIQTFSDIPSHPDIILLIMPKLTNPINPKDRNQAKYNLYRSFLEQIATEKKLPLIDSTFILWPDTGLYLEDDIHLTISGYERIAQEIFNARMDLFAQY